MKLDPYVSSNSGLNSKAVAISSDVEHRLVDTPTGWGAFPLLYAQGTGLLLDCLRGCSGRCSVCECGRDLPIWSDTYIQ
jgi:hypothetical protein